MFMRLSPLSLLQLLLCYRASQRDASHLRCDLVKSVWSRACGIFLLNWIVNLKRYSPGVQFAENPTWIGPVVPKLEQLKDSQNNRKQNKTFFFWLYLTINVPDLRLIPLDCNTFKNCTKETSCFLLPCINWVNTYTHQDSYDMKQRLPYCLFVCFGVSFGKGKLGKADS